MSERVTGCSTCKLAGRAGSGSSNLCTAERLAGVLTCSAGAQTFTWSTCCLGGAPEPCINNTRSFSSAAAKPLAASAAVLAASGLQPGLPTAARPGASPAALDWQAGGAALPARYAASGPAALARDAGGCARGFASVQPEHTVYSGPQTAPARRVTLRTLRAKHARGEPLTMVTAYDYPSAVHVPPPLTPCLEPAMQRQSFGGGEVAY